MTISVILAAALSAGMAVQPVPAGPDAGPEAISAHYYGPPTTTEAPRVVAKSLLAKAGPIGLARSIGKVDEALAQCKSMRLQMEALIGDVHGSYTVHPDWVAGYQSCLEVRFDEIKDVREAIDARQQNLLNGEDGEAAMRAADAVARLMVYQIDVRKAVEAELQEQKAFVEFYNFGHKGRAADTGNTAER